MYNNKKILAIIPARKGSKGIPNKNMKLLNGKPLIRHIIDKLNKVKYIDRIIVSTDSNVIINYCQKIKNIICIKRTKNLCLDNTTLDPVIYDAYCKISKTEYFDYIFTFQPTSPLIKISTIEDSIKRIIIEKGDTLITVVDDRHLTWTIKNNKSIPNYQKRINRQKLPINYKETGSIIACSSNIIKKDSRIGGCVILYEVSQEESVDIDNYLDWILAEQILKIPEIGIIIIGSKETGLGHIYRGITIANKLNKKPLFFTKETNKIAIQKVKESHYKIEIYKNITDLIDKLKKNNIKLVINDTLDTDKDYIDMLKLNKRFVVTFEDLGIGSEYANLVFNALYEFSQKENNKYFGHKYYCLRDEFLIISKHKVRDKCNNILITFGGSDPNNLSEKILDWIINEDVEIKLVLGLAYKKCGYLKGKYKTNKNVKIFQNITNMASFMIDSDIIITSNGRTTYESSSLGVPTISISQNERELKHTFGEVTGSIIHLGLASNLNKHMFIQHFNRLKNKKSLREYYNKKMLSLNLEKGIDRVINLIIDNYDIWRKENE